MSFVTYRAETLVMFVYDCGEQCTALLDLVWVQVGEYILVTAHHHTYRKGLCFWNCYMCNLWFEASIFRKCSQDTVPWPVSFFAPMFEYNLGAIHLLCLVVSDGAELELRGSIEYVDLPSAVTLFVILWFIAVTSFGYNGFALWFVISLRD